MDGCSIDSFESKFKFALRNLKFAILLGALLFALCPWAEAQQPGKIPWIGYLAGAGSGPSPAFMQGLRDLGYVEGKNIGFVFRTTEGKNERYSDLAAELVRLNVDIIVVGGEHGYPRCPESDQHNPNRHVECR